MQNYHENRIDLKTMGVNTPVSFDYKCDARSIAHLAQVVFMNVDSFIRRKLR